MLRKLMIAPYFGGLPVWFDKLLHNTNTLVPHGWNFLFWPDRRAFDELVKKKLGVRVGWNHPKKVTDLFPMFGVIFEDWLEGFDYWGYCGMDEVWGRVHMMLPDHELCTYDVWSCDEGMLCGPCTLFRNCHNVNELFKWDGKWREVVEDVHYYGWDEAGFDKLVKGSGLQVGYSRRHAYGDPLKLKMRNDGALLMDSKEIMMFHFNRTQRWPLSD